VTDAAPAGDSPGDIYLFSGGKIKVWLDFTPDFDPTSPGSGVTDGDLWLDLDFVPGGSLSFPTATLSASIGTDNYDPEGELALVGSGSSLLEVVGGSAADQFDTNTYTRLDGGGFADMTMKNDFYILAGGETKDGWPVWSKDPIGANAKVIPEPATMLLFGTGMMGAFLRRKKRLA